MSDSADHLHLDPDSEYFGMKLNRNGDGRVVLAFGSVLAKAGDKVRFLNKNGHEHEREEALRVLGENGVATVERISVGRSSSRYYFVGIPSYWNTVMFETVSDEVPTAGEACIACDVPFVEGVRVLPDASGGFIHVECCGPERESYTGFDGEPLKQGEPIPAGTPWPPNNKAEGET